MANNLILERLLGVKKRFVEVGDLLTSPDVMSDMKRYIKLNKEYKELKGLLDYKVTQEPKDLKDFKEKLDHKEVKEFKVRKVQPVLKVHRVIKAHKELKVHKVKQVLLFGLLLQLQLHLIIHLQYQVYLDL